MAEQQSEHSGKQYFSELEYKAYLEALTIVQKMDIEFLIAWRHFLKDNPLIAQFFPESEVQHYHSVQSILKTLGRFWKTITDKNYKIEPLNLYYAKTPLFEVSCNQQEGDCEYLAISKITITIKFLPHPINR